MAATVVGVGAVSEEDPLARYRRMRDFAATPEPAGAPPVPDPDADRFVIQEHDATRLHWDLRLEREGVLVSFALTRGLPWSPDQDRLAVHTEDHPLEYLDFHGDIPAGQYGAGSMVIWDRGTYETETFTDRKVVVTLHGARARGTYALFPVRERDWMIHRVDPPADPGRRPLPSDLRPMRPGGTGMPDDPAGWAFEIRWVGARALATNEGGRATIQGEDGQDLGERFPEVRRVGRALGAVEAVVDTVLVAVDRDGRPVPDRAPMERRLSAGSPSIARRLSEERPAAAMVVDLLWLEGHPTTDLAYDDRRTLLQELELEGPAWQTPRHHTGDGAALLRAARAQGLPGLVAKRRSSPYRPGGTSDDWRIVTP